MSCIKPWAPAEETASALKFDSARITALISSGGKLYFAAASLTVCSIICRSVEATGCDPFSSSGFSEGFFTLFLGSGGGEVLKVPCSIEYSANRLPIFLKPRIVTRGFFIGASTDWGNRR